MKRYIKSAKAEPKVKAYFWDSTGDNMVVLTDGKRWVAFDGAPSGKFDGVVDLYYDDYKRTQDDVLRELKRYISTTDFNYFEDILRDCTNCPQGNNFESDFDDDTNSTELIYVCDTNA